MDHRPDLKEFRGQVINLTACSEIVAIRLSKNDYKILRLTCDCRQVSRVLGGAP